jgi:hypothetical protein
LEERLCYDLSVAFLSLGNAAKRNNSEGIKKGINYLMKRSSILTIAALCLTASVGFGQSAKFNASRTFNFDPDHTGGVNAYWANGVGLPDASGNSNFGLYAEKTVATSANAAAGAVLDGLKGVVVQTGDTLGYDMSNDSTCASGPRFNVSYTLPNGTSGFSFVGGCNNSTKTVSCQNPNWTRNRLNLQDPNQAFPIIPAGSVIQSVVLIVDEQGTYKMDNINFRDQIATKPGTSSTSTGCP